MKNKKIFVLTSYYYDYYYLDTQCENLIIFIPLTFYVTSILANSVPQKLPIEVPNLDFSTFQPRKIVQIL